MTSEHPAKRRRVGEVRKWFTPPERFERTLDNFKVFLDLEADVDKEDEQSDGLNESENLEGLFSHGEC
jgi:hypothetical protein